MLVCELLLKKKKKLTSEKKKKKKVLSWQTDFCKHTIKEAMTLCAIYVIVVFGGRLLMTKYQAFELKMYVSSGYLY
jgi:hypothetical protein